MPDIEHSNDKESDNAESNKVEKQPDTNPEKVTKPIPDKEQEAKGSNGNSHMAAQTPPSNDANGDVVMEDGEKVNADTKANEVSEDSKDSKMEDVEDAGDQATAVDKPVTTPSQANEGPAQTTKATTSDDNVKESQQIALEESTSKSVDADEKTPPSVATTPAVPIPAATPAASAPEAAQPSPVAAPATTQSSPPETQSTTPSKAPEPVPETTSAAPVPSPQTTSSIPAPTSETKPSTPAPAHETPSSTPAPAPVLETATPAVPSPAPPVLRGTLSYNDEMKRHLIRGMWNYENSSLPAQRFELVRNLDAGEDPKELPKDGEFHGSFSLAYVHTTSKGKQKERSKVIAESGVGIKFTKVENEAIETWKVDGKGTNQFGIFHINGTATPKPDGEYTIVLRKRYEPSSQPPVVPLEEGSSKAQKQPKATEGSQPKSEGPLPPPSQSYDKNVVCLRGKLYKEIAQDVEFGLGTGDVVHRIHGMWSPGLDFLLSDPQNVKGLCNLFEYEHKSSQPSPTFPVSGRYSGWFDLNMEDGSKKKISEKDITLRFRKNNAGYHNVEGRGSNAFGKYSITGTMTADNVITIFRHFQQKKVKNARPVTSAPPPINAPGQARRPTLPVALDPKLKLEDVVAPDESGLLAAASPPELPTYSAVSRGVLRSNDDGSLSCQGKWAVTREHFTNGQTSNFTFRLESHFATEAVPKQAVERNFPLDSEKYKGSFQLKKGGTRYQTVVDQQVVMKFRKNSAGSYNVYGKGINAIGAFNLTGTLIMSGKSGGQVELYRMYPPELLTKTPAKANSSSIGKTSAMPGSEIPPKNISLQTNGAPAVPPARGSLVRRESSRMVKIPSRLEDDDPKAQLQRIMEKCANILRFMREKDVERGAFFSEPVDPLALGIPTYLQVIREPMDLRTLHQKMEAGEVDTPEKFGHFARLVFQNAMTFNVDPTHSVHQAARNLLILFNQKYRDVERSVGTLRRKQGGDLKGKKGDKKRKREEPPKTLKMRRFDEVQQMAAANASTLQALEAAAPSTLAAPVSRNEFGLMMTLLKQLQQQVVQTYTVLAEMTPDTESDPSSAFDMASSLLPATNLSSLAPDQKKAVKRKLPEPKVVEKPPVLEDDRPLTRAEQELLTETINEVPAEQFQAVCQIIREAAQLADDEQVIDLEIDELDSVTQRKLWNFVTKHVKPPKRQKGKAAKKAPAPKRSKPPAKKAKTQTSAPAPAPASIPQAKDPDSFFAFGNNEDSDSESDADGETAPSVPVPAAQAKERTSSFTLGDGMDLDEDNDKEDEAGDGAPAAWNISELAADAQGKEGDDDGEWGAAKKSAAAAKARDEDKKKREEKMKAKAEQMKEERLAEAVAHGEEMKAQMAAEEEEGARLKEEQEQKAEEQRQKAREEARAQSESMIQTVDLDKERDIMKDYEQSFLDKEMGGASPSSDFGF